ncbi:MAG TPA: tetratricopeptide repeat protein [Chitinophagaceae bacterium]|nr:tetratricopeptide repeat protein [Chitinophagaceae bacterium]
MADKKTMQGADSGEVIIAKAKDFWDKNNKVIMTVCTVIILLVGGFYVYKNFFRNPKETKAEDLIFKAEEYYRMDSLNKALNGDGLYSGFIKVIEKYGSTKAGNRASYYAGVCYLKLDSNEKAIKYLKKFSSSAKQIQAQAYKMLGDAYGDLGKNKESLDYYKKAAYHFEKDEANSANYLFLASQIAQKMGDKAEAIKLLKDLKAKYPSQRGQDGNNYAQTADNYLAQLGVYSTEE